MAKPDPATLAARPPLARALRGVRLARGLGVAETARRMGLEVRVYANFESGRCPASLARLLDFVRVTQCDPISILRCAMGGDPDMALACLDNQALSIAVGAVEDLHRRLATALSTVNAAEIVSAFDAAQRQLASEAFAKSRARLNEAEAPGAPVTPRQLECLRWVQAGKSAYDIGVILGISPRTVDTHILEACARLGVRTRMQAVLAAIEVGILSPHPP
jgi:DNA-binding CsgD family transcriptional regulator